MSLQEAIEIVHNPKTSVSTKTRVLYYLRCLDTEEAALALQKCMTNSSVLIDHEVAYILGQMKQEATIPFLFELIENSEINPIVRHEAIEALGNFEDKSLIARLEPLLSHPIDIIQESAVLAIKKLQTSDTKKESFSKYHSRDPAYPFEGTFEDAVKLFNSDDIESKYRAIFYFRDLNTPEAVEMLGSGFKFSSDLLKHEIAYVFGQMENPLSVKALIEVLLNENEADIVRHEAAEALGNIATDEALACLEKFVDSDIVILKESSTVGLGISANDEDDYSNLEKLRVTE